MNLADFVKSLSMNLANLAKIVPILQLAVGIYVSIVATIALTTWRKQLRAQKQLSFINDLSDIVHEFILSMATPTKRLEFAKIGIDAYKGVPSKFDQYDNAEIIAFINRQGSDISQKITADLAHARPVLGKMQSFVAKGQVLGFQNYSKCQDACTMLAWSYNQLQAFCGIIEGSNPNWEHPLVQKNLNLLSKIDADSINLNLEAQNKKFLEFTKTVHENT